MNQTNWYLRVYMIIVGLLFLTWVPFGTYTVYHIASVERHCSQLGYTGGWVEQWSYNGTTGCVTFSKDSVTGITTVVRDTVLTYPTN